MTAFRYRPYRWQGDDEWLAEVGEGLPILLVPPLLEELNRCRALLAAIMRGLAAAGFHAVLPDLPGTGESPRELGDTGWSDWTGVLNALASKLNAEDQAPVLASFRGGCLLEPVAGARHWRFAPVAGAALTRDLIRAKQATLAEKTSTKLIEEQARAEPSVFAGYALSAEMFSALADAAPVASPGVRTVRLNSDPADADLKLEGKPLWRQAEPGQDAVLAERLAADIADWARRCAG